MEAFYQAALLQAHGIGPAALRQLLKEAGSAEAAWQESRQLAALTEEQRDALAKLKKRSPELPQRMAEQAERAGIKAVTEQDALYPAELKEIFSPPPVLFYRGRLEPQARRLAIVGSRRMSRYGKSVAQELAEGLAAAGVTVVSGAARGIDTAAHTGALQKGRTVAVLGCGADVVYPSENGKLLAQIAETGAVLSEYPPGTRPLAAFFPARNRIISGLSAGTVVVEAAEKSGSLITAELALSEGRDVFAVPGSIYSATSSGCNRLIQQGAKLVLSVEDILSEYAWGRPEEAQPQAKSELLAQLMPEELAVLRVLPPFASPEQALSTDEIIFRLHGSMEAANIAFLLLQMELKGLIEEDENHAYSRVIKEDIL